MTDVLVRAAAVRGQQKRDAEDAAKWRALMSCDRIRLMARTDDLNHVGLEFWRRHESKHPDATGRREVLHPTFVLRANPETEETN